MNKCLSLNELYLKVILHETIIEIQLKGEEFDSQNQLISSTATKDKKINKKHNILHNMKCNQGRLSDGRSQSEPSHEQSWPTKANLVIGKKTASGQMRWPSGHEAEHFRALEFPAPKFKASAEAVQKRHQVAQTEQFSK